MIVLKSKAIEYLEHSTESLNKILVSSNSMNSKIVLNIQLKKKVQKYIKNSINFQNKISIVSNKLISNTELLVLGKKKDEGALKLIEQVQKFFVNYNSFKDSLQKRIAEIEASKNEPETTKT